MFLHAVVVGRRADRLSDAIAVDCPDDRHILRREGLAREHRCQALCRDPGALDRAVVVATRRRLRLRNGLCFGAIGHRAVVGRDPSREAGACGDHAQDEHRRRGKLQGDERGGSKLAGSPSLYAGRDCLTDRGSTGG